MSNDQDLAAVRELRAAVAEPTDLAVARTRRRALQSRQSTVHHRRRGWLPVVGAAAGIVMVVGLVVAIQASRDQPTVQAGAAPSATAETIPSSLRVDMTDRPVQLPPGAFLLIRRTTGNLVHETWVEPEGFIVRSIARSDSPGLVFNGSDEQRATFAQQGPSLEFPTPAYLAGLPADPAHLLALVTDQLGRTGSGTPRNDLIFKNGSFFIANAQPLLSPVQLAAFLEGLSHAPGASVDRTPRTWGGHSVYLVQQASSFGLAGFIVDTGDGQVVGTFAGPGGLTDNNAEQLSYAVVGEPGQRR